MNELPAPQRGIRWDPTALVLAVVIAVFAAVWHALLMTRATNDNFLHLTLAQQWLRGDWPVRDFFDQGWVLQYTLSAAAHLLLGERIGAEAVLVGIAWAVSACLVFATTRRLTGSNWIAFVSALLLIVASARGYSYPKGIVYAMAAWLWWRYIDQPSTKRAAILGVWAAIAFYWRPDHGVYVAGGVALAMVAAHGVSRLTVVRGVIAGALTLACLMPFFVYVQLVYGLAPYARTGLVQAEVEHESHGTHEWPLLRYGSSLMTFEPADAYAPIVGIRWRRDSSPAQRAEVLARYQAVGLDADKDDVQRVRLSSESIGRVRALINEPLIDDTAGIDRSTGTIMEKYWPPVQRRRFAHRWLRVRVLPELGAPERASEFTAALFFACPIVMLLGASVIAPRLRHTRVGAAAAFAAFAIVVAWAMIRNPFPARVADAVVLSSIAFGCCLGSLWREGTSCGIGRSAARFCSLLMAGVVVWIVSASGRFESPLTWLSGAADTYGELTATPPLQHYLDRPARFTLRLAAYVRDCVPTDDRLLVLWFEPEIYYYSERLMAQRHLVFAPAWATLESEQRATLDKIDRFKPPLVLARQSALDDYARATFPDVIAYVTHNYSVAATVHDAGEDYLIYARRDRQVVRLFDPQPWPCFTATPSPWVRVGRVP